MIGAPCTYAVYAGPSYAHAVRGGGRRARSRRVRGEHGGETVLLE